MWAGVVVISAAECATPFLILPRLLRFGGGAIQLDLVGDLADPSARDRMMMAAGIFIAFGQKDMIAPDMVHRANMRTVRTHDLLMFATPGKLAALTLPVVPPRSEIILEA